MQLIVQLFMSFLCYYYNYQCDDAQGSMGIAWLNWIYFYIFPQRKKYNCWIHQRVHRVKSIFTSALSIMLPGNVSFRIGTFNLKRNQQLNNKVKEQPIPCPSEFYLEVNNVISHSWNISGFISKACYDRKQEGNNYITEDEYKEDKSTNILQYRADYIIGLSLQDVL